MAGDELARIEAGRHLRSIREVSRSLRDGNFEGIHDHEVSLGRIGYLPLYVHIVSKKTRPGQDDKGGCMASEPGKHNV